MGFLDLLAAADARVTDRLGQEIVYTNGLGGAVAVSGIYDATFQLVDVGEPGVASAGPAVFLTLADLPGDPEAHESAGVLVTDTGESFTVHTVRKDGKGGVVLLLHRT